MRAMIVDDEQPLLDELERMLQLFAQVEVVGAYADPLEALREAARLQPDTVFLDIEMWGISGIELAERLLGILPQLDIIFVTAYNCYATEAFDANAVDYILKPVRQERLEKALGRLHKRKGQAEPAAGQRLRIQTFGKFGIYIGDKAIKWSRSKPRELLAYLLQSEGRWVDKYKICDDLWRDSPPEQALANLQTAVWAIRKLFREHALTSVQITFASDSYILTMGDADWDFRQFQAAAAAFQETGSATHANEALRLYGDGYLVYEDWLWALLEREACVLQQEALREQLSGERETL